MPVDVGVVGPATCACDCSGAGAGPHDAKRDDDGRHQDSGTHHYRVTHAGIPRHVTKA